MTRRAPIPARMRAPSAAELERELDVLQLLQAMNGIQTEFVSIVRGMQVNGVLYSGSFVIGAAGYWHKSFAVPFAHAFVGGTAHPVTVVNDHPQAAPPPFGPGVFPSAGVGMGWNMAGRSLTIYGTPGDIGVVEIDIKPHDPSIAEPAAGGPGGGTTNVQAFSAAGAFTWTKPPGVTTVRVLCQGAGGGGGSGGAAALGTAATGGGGGGSGAYSEVSYLAADLPATVAVTIGAGGAGGNPASGANNPGSTGAATSFGPYLSVGGGGGSNGTGAGSSSTAGLTSGGAGAAGGTGAGGPSSRVSYACGGGGGGGVTAANATFAGGLGQSPTVTQTAGALGGTNNGGAGTNATAAGTTYGAATGGGGGGSATGTTNGGAGGAGLFGSGGGGGGAANGTGTSGPGGAGGAGYVVVIAS